MLHSPSELFALSGLIEGDQTIRGGFAVAPTPEAVIEGFRDLGFRVVSVSSMVDVATTIEAMEALLAPGDPTAGSDVLDLLTEETPRNDAVLYTFTGVHDQASTQIFAGFAAASDRRLLTDYLFGVGFTAHSVVSLADLRSVYADLQRFASGDDDENLVSFKP